MEEPVLEINCSYIKLWHEDTRAMVDLYDSNDILLERLIFEAMGDEAYMTTYIAQAIIRDISR